MTHYPDYMKPTIIRLKETDSTNNYLRGLLQKEKPADFTVIVTDFQYSGRGQRGNSWESEQGKNLLFSVLLKPHFVPARSQFLISQISSLAVKESLDRFATGFSIKWPNDIYWNDKKICGMLIEHDLSGVMLSESIPGIGVNVNQEKFLSNAPNPVSLLNITGKMHESDEVLDDILSRLSRYYEMLSLGKTEEISGRYHKSLFRKEGFHLYADKKGEFHAKIIRVEPDGRLILETEGRERREYLFKEVQCVLK